VINLVSRTLIERPLEEVFDFVSTPENDFQWQYGTLASARISEGTNQRGMSFRSIGHYLGHRMQGTFEVTEYETDRKYGFKSLSGPWQSHTSYTFEVNDGSTQIEISIQVTMINFHQVKQGALEKDMKKQLKENLAILKGLLEASYVWRS
jgi:hypothetical protein